MHSARGTKCRQCYEYPMSRHKEVIANDVGGNFDPSNCFHFVSCGQCVLCDGVGASLLCSALPVGITVSADDVFDLHCFLLLRVILSC